MTKENLITAPVGTNLERAKEILKQHKIEKLPLVDEEYGCGGSSPSRILKRPGNIPAAKDDMGRLRGAALGVGADSLNGPRL